MEKKDKSKTEKTNTVGSTDYKGYCSKNVSKSYDKITQSIKDKASDLGGTFDNSTDTYDGNRFRFPSKESRNKFNNELDKMKKKQQKEKIKKIVKEVLLRELHYQTGDNARIEAERRGDKERAKKFAEYRNKSFNRDFGSYHDDGNGNKFKISMSNGVFNEPKLNFDKLSGNKYDSYGTSKFSHETYPTAPYYHSTGETEWGTSYNNMSGHDKEPNANGNKRYARAMAKADNEFNDYLDGINQYEKGKGYIKKGKPQGASIENSDGTPNTGKKSHNKDWHEYLNGK